MNNINKKLNWIIDSFKNKDIIIILVSYQIQQYRVNIQFQKKEFQPIVENKFYEIRQLFINQRLDDKQISEIFQILNEILKKYNNRIILVIFSEYFFARKPLYEYETKKIMNLFYDLVAKNNNNEILYLMNFLYKISRTIKNEEKEELKIYLSRINAEAKLFDTNPSSSTKLIRDETNLWFTNESFMVYNTKVIFSQKKQSYSEELKLPKFNFLLGFGGKQSKIKDSEPEYILFQYLDSAINIDICLDIQHKYSFNRKKFMNDNISFLDAKDQKIIEKKRKIFAKYNNGENYNEKEFYIIQSNTTNINNTLKLFPNKKIIMQIDPISSGIIYTNYTDAFNSKINDIRNNLDEFFIQLENKNIFLLKNDKNINKELQEREISKVKHKTEEVYDLLIDQLYESNFYNIVELIRPEKTITKDIGNIKLEILISDLKKNLIKK